jgi:hypothetical protein
MKPQDITHSTVSIDSEEYHVIVMPADTKPGRTILLAPPVWGWVALKICEGILSAVGAKIFSELFGSTSLTKEDLVAALKEFLSAVEAVVNRVIRQDDIEKLDFAAQELQTKFTTYITTGDTRWLMDIMSRAAELNAQYARFPYQTIGAFATVASLELAAFQESANTAPTVELRNGYKARLGTRAGELVNIGDQILPALASFNESRFGPVRYTRRQWVYSLDGNVIGHFSDQATATRDREARISSQLNYLKNQILEPFYPVEAKWKQIAGR